MRISNISVIIILVKSGVMLELTNMSCLLIVSVSECVNEVFRIVGHVKYLMPTETDNKLGKLRTNEQSRLMKKGNPIHNPSPLQQ